MCDMVVWCTASNDRSQTSIYLSSRICKDQSPASRLYHCGLRANRPERSIGHDRHSGGVVDAEDTEIWAKVAISGTVREQPFQTDLLPVAKIAAPFIEMVTSGTR